MAQQQKKSEEGLPQGEIVAKNMESQENKLPYPKSVFFIVTNEFCERFSFYGMRAVLTLYLTNALSFSETSATVIYHGFVMAAYFTPLIGAMLADAVLGKFKTIFYLSIVYATGSIVLSLAATPTLGLPQVEISMLGLALIALGTGGIKPCVSAFGGDQFVLPQQAAQLATFFSFFYMAINAGALLSTFTTPIMRSDVQCFDQDSCYPLAFAVPAGLMVVSIVIFVAGKFMYRETKPAGNVVVKVIKCIGHAIGNKFRSKSHNYERSHWLEHADDKYDQRFIEDVKIVLRVLLLYIPLPVFWALYDQQGSSWTLQANRMDGVVGTYTIKPDQVQVLSALLILIFVPLFDHIVYPLLAKCNLLKKPLQRLCMGGILAGASFIISGVLEMELEKTYPNRLGVSESNLHFVNTLPCGLSLQLGSSKVELGPRGSFVFEAVSSGQYNLYNKTAGAGVGIQMTLDEECANIGEFWLHNAIEFTAAKSAVELEEQIGTEAEHDGGGFSYMITFNYENKIQLAYGDRSDDRDKPKDGNPKIRFLVGGDYFLSLDENALIPQGKLSVYLQGAEKSYEFVINRTTTDPEEVGFASETQTVEPIPHTLKLIYGGTPQNNPSVVVDFSQILNFKLGGSYLVTLTRNGTYDQDQPLVDFDQPDSYVVTSYTITKESTLHMFWLLPQYIVITAGEIMFSITGLEFSYSQSPISMKSVMQSAWLMTVAFGNLLVMIIAEANFFEEKSKEAFLFAGIMFVDMILFGFMAYRYVPAQLEDPSKKEAED